jgi:hypothetical protein
LTGYDLPLEEIKRFRKWGSKTPGHPARGQTPGVEVMSVLSTCVTKQTRDMRYSEREP